MDYLEAGEPARLEAIFTNFDGELEDPTVVTLVIIEPDGTTTTITSPDAALHNPSVGYWYYDLTVQAGITTYRFTGTGDVAAGDTAFLIAFDAGTQDTYGPCEDWCSAADVEACGTDTLDPDVVARMIPIASSVMYQLSWRQFPGLCRAIRSVCYSIRGCSPTRCQCSRHGDLLDLGPDVAGVLRVTIDGEDLDPADYRVDDWRYLRRLDGRSWPRCADLDDPEAFQVDWIHGRQIPAGGRAAAASLTRELVLGCVGGPCALPKRITSVNREGVSFTLVDPQAIIEKGATGLTEVDLWLWSVTVGATEHVGGIFDPGAQTHMVATDT